MKGRCPPEKLLCDCEGAEAQEEGGGGGDGGVLAAA